MMTPIELRDRIIEEGIASVEESANAPNVVSTTKPYQREGARLGFEMCRYLETLEEFEALIHQRTAAEARMATAHVPEEEYWRHRYATLQVEFVYERMKVVLPTPPGTMVSAVAVLHVRIIVKEMKK